MKITEKKLLKIISKDFQKNNAFILPLENAALDGTPDAIAFNNQNSFFIELKAPNTSLKKDNTPFKNNHFLNNAQIIFSQNLKSQNIPIFCTFQIQNVKFAFNYSNLNVYQIKNLKNLNIEQWIKFAYNDENNNWHAFLSACHQKELNQLSRSLQC